ncbi:uncharacterized protein LOC124536960 [Vanessa cardui]|uniref:uncharacterized protein LOC124536960 n=1 Tax=Vanessa cardui TaxID=171605 RepID=UPI001F12DCBE|nr:uncharacterized protein LOC124536960 [Vanessa cardui]
MSKIALVVLRGCVFYGLFNMVTSEQLFLAEREFTGLEDARDENKEISDRTGAQANAVTSNMYRPKPNAIPAPSPNPVNLRECYVCTDCPKVLHNTSSKLCPYTLDVKKQGCVVYAEQYKYMKKPWYIRGCASERGSCADIRKAHSSHTDVVSLLSCHDCEGDKCNKNGASHLSDFTVAFLAMIVTPLLTKYTLS